MRAVDTAWKDRTQPYRVEGDTQPGGAVRNAVITTPLFTVKAPLARVREAGSLVKIEVLARVK